MDVQGQAVGLAISGLQLGLKVFSDLNNFDL